MTLQAVRLTTFITKGICHCASVAEAKVIVVVVSCSILVYLCESFRFSRSIYREILLIVNVVRVSEDQAVIPAAAWTKLGVPPTDMNPLMEKRGCLRLVILDIELLLPLIVLNGLVSLVKGLLLEKRLAEYQKWIAKLRVTEGVIGDPILVFRAALVVTLVLAAELGVPVVPPITRLGGGRARCIQQSICMG